MTVQSPLRQLQMLTQGDPFIFQNSLEVWMKTDITNNSNQVYCVRLSDGTLQLRGADEGVILVPYHCSLNGN